MPLEDGRPRLKLSYNSAPFVLGNPLPPCIVLDDDNGLPFGEVMIEDELVLNEGLGLIELLDSDGGLVGEVFTVLPKEAVLAYGFETGPFIYFGLSL